MSGGKHTAGRLTVKQEFANRWRVYATPEPGCIPLSVATVCTTLHEVGIAEEGLTAANARRIVACWNACMGLSTEALERLGTLDKARVELDVLRVRAMKQRDELAEALQLMLEQFTKTPSTLKDSEARIKAHAALSRATGSKV